MATIRRLVLRNFKRFKTLELELEFDPELNILVGGNEAGKSSVRYTLDIVCSFTTTPEQVVTENSGPLDKEERAQSLVGVNPAFFAEKNQHSRCPTWQICL